MSQAKAVNQSINQEKSHTHTHKDALLWTHLQSVIRESEPRLALAVVAPEGVEATGVAATNLRCLLALIEV